MRPNERSAGQGVGIATTGAMQERPITSTTAGKCRSDKAGAFAIKLSIVIGTILA
jgi:hypothetical protein